MKISKTKITADDEIMIPEGEVEIEPEATDLLFETEDVAELLAEATGEDIEVTADEDEVTFGIGEDEITITAEGDEEILESSTKKLAGKRTVAASTRRTSASRRKPVSASKKTRFTVKANK